MSTTPHEAQQAAADCYVERIHHEPARTLERVAFIAGWEAKRSAQRSDLIDHARRIAWQAVYDALRRQDICITHERASAFADGFTANFADKIAVRERAFAEAARQTTIAVANHAEQGNSEEGDSTRPAQEPFERRPRPG